MSSLHNGAASPPSSPADLPLFEKELTGRLAAAGAAGVTAEVGWMDTPVPGFRVTLREAGRTEMFGVPTQVLKADPRGRTLDRIVADALRRLRAAR
jgi:hypothetical protein